MGLDDSRQAGANEIEVTPAMIAAGLDELLQHSFADVWPDVLEAIYRSMAYASVAALSTSVDRYAKPKVATPSGVLS